MSATDCPILADPKNAEAMATALVLASLLRPHALSSQVPIPAVLLEDEEVSESAQTLGPFRCGTETALVS